MIILIASLFGAPALAQGAATVRVDPSTASVQVNNTANIAVKVDNISNLTAFELHLSFDPAVLEVTSVTNGGFVSADFVAQDTFKEDPNKVNTLGEIDYAIAQMNRTPANGSGTLLNIVFRAKAAGSSTVTTRATPAAPDGLLLADANGIAIQAAWAPGTINVGSGTPTYTPTSTLTPTPTPTTAPGSGTPTYTPTPTPTSSTTPATATPTVTPIPTASQAPTSSGVVGTHIVRWGEWLYCIARAYKVSPWAIAKENGLWWPYLIFPNQRLTIPNVPDMNIPAGPVCKAQFTMPAPNSTPTPTATPAAPTSTPTPTNTAPPSACRAIYVVRPGDTLYRIARWYGTSYTEIAQVNRISNPRLIYPGQSLCIP